MTNLANFPFSFA